GLRAFAVLLVVAFHANVPGISGGFVGVDVFFVLSGYLITGLLLAERERTGRIALANFGDYCLSAPRSGAEFVGNIDVTEVHQSLKYGLVHLGSAGLPSSPDLPCLGRGCGMSDGQMRVKQTPYPSVRGQFIGHECRFLIHPPQQSPPELRRTVRGNHFLPCTAIPFDGHQHAGFPVATPGDPSPSRPRSPIPLARLAADIGLVRFNDPGESLPQERMRGHESSDPMRQMPGDSATLSV